MILEEFVEGLSNRIQQECSRILSVDIHNKSEGLHEIVKRYLQDELSLYSLFVMIPVVLPEAGKFPMIESRLSSILRDYISEQKKVYKSNLQDV